MDARSGDVNSKLRGRRGCAAAGPPLGGAGVHGWAWPDGRGQRSPRTADIFLILAAGKRLVPEREDRPGIHPPFQSIHIGKFSRIRSRLGGGLLRSPGPIPAHDQRRRGGRDPGADKRPFCTRSGVQKAPFGVEYQLRPSFQRDELRGTLGVRVHARGCASRPRGRAGSVEHAPRL